MWSIKQDYHASGAIEVFETEGIPVLVVHGGRYPQAESDDGRSTRDVPHILISVWGGTDNETRFFSGVSVSVMGTWHRGFRRAMKVFEDVVYGGSRREPTPDAWVALGKSKLDAAVNVLNEIDARYESAASMIERGYAYMGPMTREEYEAACAACEVESLSDSECLSYGVEYGVFSYPEYEPEHIVKMHLAKCRNVGLRDEQAAVEQSRPMATPEKPVPQGQLWEPCEQCGAEPVYMPLHLCARCWPK